MTNFTARELTKAGFQHLNEEDFSDDGTYFKVYALLGVKVSYAKVDGQVYLSARFDYGDIPFDTYRLFPSYARADEFNGVDESKVDVARFKETISLINQDIVKFHKGEKVFETDVTEMTPDELKNYLKLKYIPYVTDDKANKVFNLAWEYGHSHGHSEVQQFYLEMAELAR